MANDPNVQINSQYVTTLLASSPTIFRLAQYDERRAQTLSCHDRITCSATVRCDVVARHTHTHTQALGDAYNTMRNAMCVDVDVDDDDDYDADSIRFGS